MQKGLRRLVRICFPRQKIREYRLWLVLGFVLAGVAILRLGVCVLILLSSPGVLNMPPQTVVFWREVFPDGHPLLLPLDGFMYVCRFLILATLAASVLWHFLFVPATGKVKVYFLCLSLYLVPAFILYPLDIRFGSGTLLIFSDVVKSAILATGALCFRSATKDFVERRRDTVPAAPSETYGPENPQ